MKCFRILLVLGTSSGSALIPSLAGQTIRIPFTADHWRVLPSVQKDPQPDVAFIRHEGFPQGAALLKSGSIALTDFVFRNGSVEFDIKALAEDIPGIQFRISGPAGQQDAEEFYIRTSPDCRASNDCVQYAPIIHGFMLWNAYPQYQTQAPILDGWNHVKLVVAGRRMNVFINHAMFPTLAVGNLESAAQEGGLSLTGPAVFANLTVSPNATEDLSPLPTLDPTLKDPGIVRHWLLGPLTSLNNGLTPKYSAMPQTSAAWQPISAGRFGLVNLNRAYMLDFHKPPSLMWLQTSVFSDGNRTCHVDLGWLGRAWIFVNGRIVTSGQNFYYPESERRDPDGRLDLQNGSFDLPLRQGSNQIVVALFASYRDSPHGINRYGAGLEMRFQNAKGLRFQSGGAIALKVKSIKR